MAKKRFKPEQIINMLREAEIELATGDLPPRPTPTSELERHRVCL